MTLMKVLLHAADVSNPAKQFAVAKQSAELIVEEFCRQGDLEKETGLKVSPMCERDDVKNIEDLARMQVCAPPSACARHRQHAGHRLMQQSPKEQQERRTRHSHG